MAQAKGWRPLRNGWPDFMRFWGLDSLSPRLFTSINSGFPSSSTMFEALEAAGIMVRVWWEREPDRLMTWRKFLAHSGFLLRRTPPNRAKRKPVSVETFSIGQVRRMIRRDRQIEKELRG
jgi:hypothetical protein